MLTLVVIALLVAVMLAALAATMATARAPAPPGPGAPADLPPEDLRPPDPLVPLAAVAGADRRDAPLPVVLVHGLFGFDRIGRFDYFRGIARHLAALGCTAHAVKLPRAAAVPDRARELVRLVEALPYPRVDLIAHSLGGLDARYALAHLGLAARVRALVTIGTPHHGTAIADLLHEGPLDWVRRLVASVGLPLDALAWLSTRSLERFNREVPDVPGVRYACVVGGIHQARTEIPLALVPAHGYLRRAAGVNDGLVPVASQVWGEVLAEIEADHLSQIGWRVTVRPSFDAAGLYAFIVARLGDRAVAASA